MHNRFMSGIDPDDASALSAWWDAVTRSERNAHSAPIDPQTAELVQRIQRASQSCVPTGGRERALEAAMRELPGQERRSNGHEMRRNDVNATIIASNGADLIPAMRRDDRRRHRRAAPPSPKILSGKLVSFVSVVAVALMLLALTGEFGAIRTRINGLRGDDPTVVPAIQALSEATPADGSSYMEVIIPARYLPTGEIYVSVWNFLQVPGTTERFSDIPPGVLLEYVYTGSYSVMSDGPRAIWRAGTNGPPDEFAAGEESTANPGDVIVYLDNATQTTTAADGEMVSALNIALIGPNGMDAEIGGATGDAIVAVRQVTLQPGESLPDSGEEHVERLIVSGEMTFEVTPAGQSTPQGSATFNEIVPEISFPEGTSVVLRNDGDEPLIFLEAVITLPSSAD